MNPEKFRLSAVLRNAARHCRNPVPNQGSTFADILDDLANEAEDVTAGKASAEAFSRRYLLARKQPHEEIEADGFITVTQR